MEGRMWPIQGLSKAKRLKWGGSAESYQLGLYEGASGTGCDQADL